MPTVIPVTTETETAEPDLLTQALELWNEEYADALLLVGQVHADPAATSCRLVALDLEGVDLALDGGAPTRVPFAEPAPGPEGLWGAAFALVLDARSRRGGEATTSVERMLAERSSIRTWLTTVARVEQVTPAVRRLTFAGGDLAGFAPLGPDTFLYLLVPPVGCDHLAIGHDFSWDTIQDLPDDVRPVGAYYTLHEWRPEQAELDVLVVLHGDHGDGSRFALRAAPGDPVALWGPRQAYRPPTGTEHVVLVADETGLPAVDRILRQLPAGQTATALVEVPTDADRLPLAERDGVEVRWLWRDGAPAGSSRRLVEEVAALGPLPTATYAWGGAESRLMTAVRRHLRDERGLAREQVDMVAYWRRDA